MRCSPVLLVPHLPTLLVDEHRGHRTEMLVALAGLANKTYSPEKRIAPRYLLPVLKLVLKSNFPLAPKEKPGIKVVEFVSLF